MSRSADPLAQAKAVALAILDAHGVSAEEHEAIATRLDAHYGSVAEACEKESASLNDAKLTPDGWLVTQAPPERLARLYAVGALLAAARAGLAAALECQRLAEHAFHLSKKSAEGDVVRRRAERETRLQEAALRSSNARKAAASKPRRVSDARLIALDEEYSKQWGDRRHGRYQWIRRRLADEEQIGEKQIKARLQNIRK